MIHIRRPTDAGSISDQGIHDLVQLRLEQLGDCDIYVAEPGDTAATLEAQSGLPIAHNPFDGLCFPDDPDFVLVAEHVQESIAAYEMTFILTDDGAGALVLIPRQSNIDANLLDLCAAFAVPAVD